MKLRQIGNSQGTTFGRDVLSKAGFEDGQELEVLASPGEIRIVPSQGNGINVPLTPAEAKALADGDMDSGPAQTAIAKVRVLVDNDPNDRLLEQHVMDRAVLYLSQVCEAMSILLRTETAENPISAQHCVWTLTQDIQKIVQSSLDGTPTKHRGWAVRDAMLKLGILVKHQGAMLSTTGMPIPSDRAISVLSLSATTL